jgi:hypothetical protein
VGGWTTTAIGRFYKGPNHSTVCYGIPRIEALRESDPDVDALITSLRTQLTSGNSMMAKPGIDEHRSSLGVSETDLDRLAELIAMRICTFSSEWITRAVRGDRQTAEMKKKRQI